VSSIVASASGQLPSVSRRFLIDDGVVRGIEVRSASDELLGPLTIEWEPDGSGLLDLITRRELPALSLLAMGGHDGGLMYSVPHDLLDDVIDVPETVEEWHAAVESMDPASPWLCALLGGFDLEWAEPGVVAKAVAGFSTCVLVQFDRTGDHHWSAHRHANEVSRDAVRRYVRGIPQSDDAEH
jgi:hypothetical protein